MLNDFDIQIATRFVFGHAAEERCGSEAHALGASKVLLHYDGGDYLEASGLLERLRESLRSAGVEFVELGGVQPNPRLELVYEGIALCREYGLEAVVAVGGGSAIDLSKAVRQFASKMDENYHPALIAIPTPSGTGSEVTAFSVVTDRSKGVKYPLVSEDMLPDEAILDEELVKSVPPSVTADTGMDVLTHAIEAYVSLNNNEFSAALAEKSIEICGTFLLRSYYDSNDAHARRKMHIASCLAGLAFNSASLGLNHGMALQLGSNFHIPHGRANAILLPKIIEYNSGIDRHSKSRKDYPPCVKKYVHVARILGLQNFNTITTVRALVNWIEFMMKEMNMPVSVSQSAKISKEEYDEKVPVMAKAALKDACTATNPRVPTEQEVIELYNQIW